MEKINQVHEGRNIKRFREMLGIKQETLAYELGEGWSQKKVSQLEEKVEEEILNQVSKILNITPEAILKFNEEAMINYSNTFYDNSSADSAYMNMSGCKFNPPDKLLEVHEENKRLYERLLEAEKAKLEYLEQLLKQK